MKQRVISGIVIGIILFCMAYFGGLFLNLVSAFIVLWGSYELCSTRNRKINWLEYACMVITSGLIVLFNDKAVGFILIELLALNVSAVFDEKLDFVEVCVTFFESVLLGFAVYNLLYVESINKFLLGYIFMIVFVTDVFALFSGMLFGKHKLNERVSPKKTIEGYIGGWLIGGTLSFIYAYFLNYCGMNLQFMIICSIILPLVSQIGDLCFSLIKRRYQVKDFSNLIPGHGGLMDRIDSLSFTLIIFGAICVFL